MDKQRMGLWEGEMLMCRREGGGEFIGEKLEKATRILERG